MKTRLCLSLLIVALAGLVTSVAPAQNAPPTNEISAGVGTCSASIYVTDKELKPIYGAKVTTRVQYGLMGVKKIDLEAYTNGKGYLKIIELPLTLKKPLYIHITKDGKEQIVDFKPEKACDARFDVLLY